MDSFGYYDIEQARKRADECALVMIDGVPHLRLGDNCGLLSVLARQQQESLPRATLDPTASSLVYGGHQVVLTRTEYRLMELLLAARGELRTYEELIGALWVDREFHAGRVSLRSMVSAIRIKLRASGIPDQLLVNIRSKGLRLNPHAA